MASEGPNGFSSVVSAGWAESTVSWTDPENGDAADESYAQSDSNSGEFDYSVRLFHSGSPIGDDLANDTTPDGTPDYVPYGGATELWGASLTPAVVNDTTFGIGYSVRNFPSTHIYEYLLFTNPGFSVPSGATIDGVLVEFLLFYNAGFGGIFVDYARITVYYTEAGGDSVSPAASILKTTKTKRRKRYLYH